MSSQDEVLDAISTHAWSRAVAILRIGAPDLIDALADASEDGGHGRVTLDTRRWPPYVCFAIDAAGLALYYYPAGDTLAAVDGTDGSERARDGAGQPLEILDLPAGAERPDLN